MIWRHDPATVAARMKELCPDIRLIAMLRNPIDRANSAMVHHIRKGRLPADSRLVDVVKERTPPEKDRLCLVAGGWYAASLEPFLDAFGDGLLLLWHDDIATDPVGVYEAALRHIGASPDFRPAELSKVIFSNRNRNPRPVRSTSSPTTIASRCGSTSATTWRVSSKCSTSISRVGNRAGRARAGAGRRLSQEQRSRWRHAAARPRNTPV